MSDTPPDDKDDKTPPAKEGLTGIDLQIDESYLDEETQASIKQMKEENAEMRKMIQDMHTKQAKEEHLAKKTSLLAELNEIEEGLASEYDKEMDLGIIATAIKVARKLKKKEEGFDEIEGAGEDTTEESIKDQHWNPIGGKGPTAKMYITDKD